MEVFLVRHGETEWSAAKRHTGRTDVPLTEAGRRHAQALAAGLAGRRLALVLTSPLARACETAALAGFPGAEPVDDLMEMDYGECEGLTTPQIRENRPGWTVWTHDCPGGETLDDVARRADRVIARVTQADGDVAIFAHGHLLRILAARWIEEPPELGGRLALSTASLSACGFEHERRVITLWNDTSHLNTGT